tara:strand:- start:4796 stop:7258 length:2463 start_codon:yes stop_codon:yes gene_type:complete
MAIAKRSVQFSFDPKTLDRKWQDRWSNDKLYHVADTSEKQNWFEMTMYPYPSGDTHIGHWYAMAPSDAHARFRRMQGYNVLHPMGFDSFGLPAENAAIRRGIHPYKWTMDNISNMKKQFYSMGTIYDWDREVNTCQPDYYKWNQWFFLKLFENGLAYRSNAPVNWCGQCQTVLANEQVINGKCDRCESIVIHRDLEQWFFKITNYAEELLSFDKVIDWPEKIKTLQENWIGKSFGVQVKFDLSHLQISTPEIETFTTRIDTLFGVTFIVLAPEHNLVSELTTPDNKEKVEKYINTTREYSEIERLSTERDKTGVFTGSYATNTINGNKVPIFIADYVLMQYGTGAVMGVPAHDQRDFEFAKKYDLDIIRVIAKNKNDTESLEEAYTESGILTNSGKFDNISNEEAKIKIAEHLEQLNLGIRTTTYRLRDWLISRQRYWGTPIPIIYCGDCGIVPVPEKDLPVILPPDAEFKPTGESPLKYHPEFINCKCPNCGNDAERETDTMDTFVDSSWYFLRYPNPKYDNAPFDLNKLKLWNPVDQYTGGAEHAVLHLMYSRFFVKALRDIGLFKFDEPFLRLFNQGMIIANHQKMSKSRGNVIAPDDYVLEFGADVVRIYLMFLGPWDQGGDWIDSGINGMARWINRVWNISTINSNKFTLTKENQDLTRTTHKLIKNVTEDIDRFKFNTALAFMMEFTNYLNQISENNNATPEQWNFAIKSLLLLLAPIAPHITEELWELTGNQYSIHNQSVPSFNPKLIEDETTTLVIQVNGKVRDTIEVGINTEKEKAEEIALSSEKIQPYLVNQSINRIIYVPDKLVNIVIK